MNEKIDLNTTQIGDISEIKTLLSMTENGFIVSFPFTVNSRYDLIVDIKGRLFKIQCKTGRLKEGSIRFKTVSSHSRNHKTKSYEGEIDYFSVYCPDNNKLYLISPDEAGKSDCYLRVDKTLNNQNKGVKWSCNYEIDKVLNEMA